MEESIREYENKTDQVDDSDFKEIEDSNLDTLKDYSTNIKQFKDITGNKLKQQETLISMIKKLY